MLKNNINVLYINNLKILRCIKVVIIAMDFI